MEKITKRILIVLVALVTGITCAYAQSSSSKSFSVSWSDGGESAMDQLMFKPHEVKVNLLSSTLLLRPEVAYDYTINPDIAVGGRMAFSINSVGVPNAELGRFQLSPYVRWHFYKETRRNALRAFFVELNTAYTYYDGIEYNPNISYESGMGYSISESDKERNGSALGLGIGIGYKWITRGAWTFELGAVFGRNLVHPEPAIWYGDYVFSIGKRF